MDLKQAKQILTGIGLDEFNKDELDGGTPYIHVSEGDEIGVLDGEFTADELEAIATWMRDPSGVVGAE